MTSDYTGAMFLKYDNGITETATFEINDGQHAYFLTKCVSVNGNGKHDGRKTARIMEINLKPKYSGKIDEIMTGRPCKLDVYINGLNKWTVETVRDKDFCQVSILKRSVVDEISLIKNIPEMKYDNGDLIQIRHSRSL